MMVAVRTASFVPRKKKCCVFKCIAQQPFSHISDAWFATVLNNACIYIGNAEL
jgi:hypothetical protein